MVGLGAAALYQCGRGKLLSPKFTFPKQMVWQGDCGLEVLSLLGTLAAGQCHVAPSCVHSPAVLQGTGKRAMSPGRKGPPSCWTRAREKCAVSRAGQGGIPGWQVCFHIHFVLSLSTKCHIFGRTLPAHHCRHQHCILCHTPSRPIPPPCLCAQGQ